jgi:S1 RNA binding domain protein
MAVVLGSIVEGTVTGITNFGAFVELPDKQVGLVHISEIADAYVKDIKEYLKEKDKVQVKIISIDGKGKIGLSIKQTQPPKSPSREREYPKKPQMSFEDRMSKFLKDSEERQLDVKKNTEAKRGGRGGPKKPEAE